jgi:hypothetical protein
MTTDGKEEELPLFAEKIGLKRAWFQPAPPASAPHYDLTVKRREAAVKAGAHELQRVEIVAHFKMLSAKVAAKRGTREGQGTDKIAG